MSAFRKISVALGSERRSSSGTRTPTDLSTSSNPHSAHSAHKRGSIAAILHRFDHKDSYSSGTDSTSSDSELEGDGTSKNLQKRLEKKQKKKEMKARMSMESGRGETEEKLKERLDAAKARETDDMRARYGDLPMSQSTTRNSEKRIDIDTLTEDMVDQEVVFRARLHHHRNMGQKLVFVMLRQRISTIQGVMVEEAGLVGPLMIHWSEHIRTGSIMRVRGIVQKPTVPVKSASIHNLEIKITHLHIIAKRAEPGKEHTPKICQPLTCPSSLLCSGSRVEYS